MSPCSGVVIGRWTDRIVLGGTVVLTVAFVGRGALAPGSLAGVSSSGLNGVLDEGG